MLASALNFILGYIEFTVDFILLIKFYLHKYLQHKIRLMLHYKVELIEKYSFICLLKCMGCHSNRINFNKC